MFNHTRSVLLIALTLVQSSWAQITYRRRSNSISRIIAGCVVGGIAAIFLLCIFALYMRRRRRSTRYNLASIPRPYVGETPFQPQQNNGQVGAPPIINAGPAQYPYPQQGNYGTGAKEQVQFQDDLPPSYMKEQDFGNPTLQNPETAHTAPQTGDDRFVGGFRPQ
ncbi:hypothetical protein MD484_g8255, partial [Candolleomyces efflorescens]